MNEEPKRNPAAGAALGALSAARNKKIMTVAGGILMAVGIAGMVAIGSQAKEAINRQLFGVSSTGFWLQMTDYVFMFILIAGLVLVIYAQISLQRVKAKQRESEMDRQRRDMDSDAQAA